MIRWQCKTHKISLGEFYSLRFRNDYLLAVGWVVKWILLAAPFKNILVGGYEYEILVTISLSGRLFCQRFPR
jgi:hypothetical protein